MIEKIFSKKIKSEREKIEVLIFLQGLFLLSSELILIVGDFKMNRLLMVPFIILILYLIRESFRRLFYTFWTLGFILLFFESYRLFSFMEMELSSSFFLLKLASIFVIALEMYYLSSPIFYPRVNWWEYDFRFKSDFKVDLKWKEDTLDGRLTDLRRGCGCVLVFKDLDLGDKVTVSIRDRDEVLEGEVISRREQVSGRPLIYGIKFDLDDNYQLNKYKGISKAWKDFKNHKRELKSIYVKNPKP